jgi:hypothetical protein
MSSLQVRSETGVFPWRLIAYAAPVIRHLAERFSEPPTRHVARGPHYSRISVELPAHFVRRTLGDDLLERGPPNIEKRNLNGGPISHQSARRPSMRRIRLLGIGLGIAALGTILWARDESNDARTGRPHAILSDALTREAARLRMQGPSSLTVMLLRRPALEKMPAAERAAATREWRALVDAVAGQRDAWVSLLYWYTDLEAAKVAAQASGKPILSLRLLGKLTDEHSCANSRFFRKTLYPNATVGKFLRENFVLHWESVRPVPTVTIDFGDGRTLKRTITGNSVHYVLDCRGRLVDAIPGLFGPQEFLQVLKPSQEVAARCGTLDDSRFCALVVEQHRQWRDDVHSRLQKDLSSLGPHTTQLQGTAELLARTAPIFEIVPAAAPAEIVPRYVGGGSGVDAARSLPDPTWPIWDALATRHMENMLGDPDAMLLATPGAPPVKRANRIARPKNDIEAPLVANIAFVDFSRNRAIDSVFNEYALHVRIHEHLSSEAVLKQSLADFTRWCYADVFLSPLDDSWYGLMSGDFGGYDEPTPSQTAQNQR